MDLNLSKDQLQTTLSNALAKKGFSTDIQAKVNIIIDGSGSMYSLYHNGVVSALVQRALTVGSKFDDDGTIDAFAFADGESHVQLPSVSQDQFSSYNVKFLNGGTDYAPVLDRMSTFYDGGVVEKKGIFGIFGKKSVAVGGEGREGDENPDLPIFSIFITDGLDSGRYDTAETIRKIVEKNPKTFIMFVGIRSADSGGSFPTLESLAKSFDNVGYFDAGNINNISDEEFFDGMLSEKAKTILTK